MPPQRGLTSGVGREVLVRGDQLRVTELKGGHERGVYLRGYVYDFIVRFAPALDRAAVDAALAARRPHDDEEA